MAFGGFGRGKATAREIPVVQAAPPPAPVPSASAYIDAGSEFEGRLSFKDTVCIDGRLLGEVTSENTLVVGESGELLAMVRSQVVIVSGRITGDVTATRQLVIQKTGRVDGDVTTPSLVMEEGGALNGRLRMSKDAPADA